MPRAPTEQAVEGTEQSQMLRNRQKSQTRDDGERQARMPQAVEEDHVTGHEYDYSQRQDPPARERTAVPFHGLEPPVTSDGITRSMEPTQEQSASHRFPRHHS